MIQIDALLEAPPTAPNAAPAREALTPEGEGFDPLLAQLFAAAAAPLEEDGASEELAENATPETNAETATLAALPAEISRTPLPVTAGYVERALTRGPARANAPAENRLPQAAGNEPRLAVVADPIAAATAAPPRDAAESVPEPALPDRFFGLERGRESVAERAVDPTPRNEPSPLAQFVTARNAASEQASGRALAEAQTPAAEPALPVPSGLESARTPVAPPAVDVGTLAGPAPAAPTPAPAAVEQVLPQRIEWLAQQGGGTARVRLDPPSLGEVDIAVRVRGDRVDLRIHAEQATAHQLIAESVDRLSDALAQRDLRVEGLELRSSDQPLGRDANASFQDFERSGEQTPARDQRGANRGNGAEQETRGDAPAEPTASDGRGIDLRV
ncbi:MAG: flagellar hook-length control protein FliK [Myxococcota bacterium]